MWYNLHLRNSILITALDLPILVNMTNAYMYRLTYTNALSAVIGWISGVREAYKHCSENAENRSLKVDIENLLKVQLENEIQCLQEYGKRLNEFTNIDSDTASEVINQATVPRKVKLNLQELKDQLLKSRGRQLTQEDLNKLQGSIPTVRKLSEMAIRVKEEMELYEKSERTGLNATYRLGFPIMHAKQRNREVKKVTR